MRDTENFRSGIFNIVKFLISWTHVFISYSKLDEQSFSIALPETSRVVAYISNQTLKVWNSFCPYYDVYRSSEYFLVVQVIENRLGTMN